MDGSIINKQLSTFGTFCLPTFGGADLLDETKVEHDLAFFQPGGQLCRIDNSKLPYALDIVSGEKPNPTWGQPTKDLDGFNDRPFGPVINFQLKYNEKLFAPSERVAGWQNQYGLTQTGCIKNIRNLRYPLQAGREYTFSIMGGVIEGGEYRTLDVLPYLTSSMESTAEDLMWCYGSQISDSNTGTTTMLSSNAFPKYALGSNGNIDLLDQVRPIRLDAAHAGVWEQLEWNFVAPVSDWPLDVINFAFIDPARRWELEKGTARDELEKNDPKFMFFGPMLMEGNTLDVHTVLNSNQFFVTFALPSNKQSSLLLSENGGFTSDRLKIETSLADGESEFKVTLSDGKKTATVKHYHTDLLGGSIGSTPMLLVGVERVVDTSTYIISISNSTHTEMNSFEDGPDQLSDQPMTIDGMPQLQINKGLPTAQHIERIRSRGFLKNIYSSSSSSTGSRILTEQNVSMPSAEAIVVGSSVFAAANNLMAGDLMTVSGWFLPTMSGKYMFLLNDNSGATNTAPVEIYINLEPSLGCSSLTKLTLTSAAATAGGASGARKDLLATEKVVLQGGFEYSYIVVLPVVHTEQVTSTLALGVIFPTGFTSFPLSNVYTSTTAQQVDGKIKLSIPPFDETEVAEVNIWNQRNALITSLKGQNWIESVTIVDDSYSQLKCNDISSIDQFDLTISNSKVNQLYGLLPFVTTSFSTMQGLVEYRITASDRTFDYPDLITSSNAVFAPINPSTASSVSSHLNQLESSFTGLPPVGTSRLALSLATCNAYGCSNPPVLFNFGIFQAPTELKYVNGKVDSGSVLLTFKLPTLDAATNILPLVQYCVEMRDQSGDLWVEVKAGRNVDGPLNSMTCTSPLGTTIACEGFKIGGLIHSTRR